MADLSSKTGELYYGTHFSTCFFIANHVDFDCPHGIVSRAEHRAYVRNLAFCLLNDFNECHRFCWTPIQARMLNRRGTKYTHLRKRRHPKNLYFTPQVNKNRGSNIFNVQATIFLDENREKSNETKDYNLPI